MAGISLQSSVLAELPFQAAPPAREVLLHRAEALLEEVEVRDVGPQRPKTIALSAPGVCTGLLSGPLAFRIWPREGFEDIGGYIEYRV